MDHARGRLEAAENGYREVLAAEPENARALHGLGVIALQTGYRSEAAGLLEQAVAVAPDFADAYCNLGYALRGLGKSAEAEVAYRRSLDLDPDMAEAHSNLGLILEETERPEEARAAFERAVDLDPGYAEAWSNLGVLEEAEGNAEAALACFERAHAAAPRHPEIAGNLAAALIEAGEVADGEAILGQLSTEMPRSPLVPFNLGRARFLQGDLAHAISLFRRAISLDPNFADAHHSLGHALLAKGELEEGWREYEWRWRAKRFRVAPRDFPFEPWQGEPLEGKRILVWSEQGVGDKLLFGGLLGELAESAGHVVLEIEPRLVPTFRRAFPDIEVVARRDPPDAELAAEFDFQAPLGDLARHLRPSAKDFQPLSPYLKADPARRTALRERYVRAGAATVGIAWASAPPKGRPLRDFADLLTLPGVRWLSVQYGDRAAEIAEVERTLGIEILHDASIDPLNDFDGSVAQTAALDAVVTIQNTTLYTAGGLGLPTFALVPPGPDWRWFGDGARSPWHENVRLFREIDALTAAFAAWLAQRPL